MKGSRQIPGASPAGARPTRRDVLRAAAIPAASLLAPIVAAPAHARPAYVGPNLIVVRFGGGVRRRETIEPGTSWSPWLLHEFAPRGTLFRNMVIDDAPHVKTNHGQGTLHLLTGRYDEFENLSDAPLGERFEPPAPTLFEYFRRAWQVAPDETLILNGEDRTSEEFYSFSNHHEYGVNYRSEVLSLYRYKTWLLQAQLAESNFPDERGRLKAHRNLQQMMRVDPRRADVPRTTQRLTAFWERWRAHYGDSGLRSPRGDKVLAEFAIRAMDTLQPKMMMLNFQDPDYVHWGYADHYTRGIAVIDQLLRSIVAHAAQHPYYANNTVFAVVPDCGRDANLLVRTPFQHHFNSRSAHDIWALFVGPGIARNRVVTREVQQIDVTRTVAALAGMSAREAAGEVLHEAFA